MPTKRDPIAVVEVCYDLAATEGEWMQRLAASMHELQGEPDAGTIAFHLKLDPLRYECVVQAGGTVDVATRVRALSEMLERRARGESTVLERVKAQLYEKVVLDTLRAPAEQVLLTEHKKVGPNWMYTAGTRGVKDIFFLISHHIDGHGATFVNSGLSRKLEVEPADRRMFQMLGAHIKSGFRLRRRLRVAREPIDSPEGGAVLDPSGQVVHAEGEAREPDAREELRRMARSVDSARSRKGRSPEALALWHGLVDGRWSLVDRFDADGRRYLVAHRNPEDVKDPRGLTEMQTRVTGLAVRGYSNTLIAYHLGLSEATISSHLHHAMRKLGIADRIDLVRMLGTHFPQPTDPRYRI